MADHPKSQVVAEITIECPHCGVAVDVAELEGGGLDPATCPACDLKLDGGVVIE